MTKQKARKQYCCDKCKRTIEPGEEYYKHSFNFSNRTMIRCTSHPFSRADLTQSEYLSTLYTIQDSYGSLDSADFNTIEDLRETVDEAYSEIVNLKESTEEKLQNMPESLQSSPNAELLQERIDSLESATDAIGNIDYDIDEPDRDDYDTDQDFEDDYADVVRDKIDEIISTFTDAINEMV